MALKRDMCPASMINFGACRPRVHSSSIHKRVRYLQAAHHCQRLRCLSSAIIPRPPRRGGLTGRTFDRGILIIIYSDPQPLSIVVTQPAAGHAHYSNKDLRDRIVKGKILRKAGALQL